MFSLRCTLVLAPALLLPPPPDPPPLLPDLVVVVSPPDPPDPQDPPDPPAPSLYLCISSISVAADFLPFPKTTIFVLPIVLFVSLGVNLYAYLRILTAVCSFQIFTIPRLKPCLSLRSTLPLFLVKWEGMVFAILSIDLQIFDILILGFIYYLEHAFYMELHYSPQYEAFRLSIKLLLPQYEAATQKLLPWDEAATPNLLPQYEDDTRNLLPQYEDVTRNLLPQYEDVTQKLFQNPVQSCVSLLVLPVVPGLYFRMQRNVFPKNNLKSLAQDLFIWQ